MAGIQKVVYASLLLITLTACNPFSDRDNSANTPERTAGIEQALTAYHGTATKGPLDDALISVYAVDSSGIKSGTAITQTTSTEGLWAININNADNDILIVEAAGGTYIDESDPETDITKKRKITLASNEVLYGVLIPGENSAAINFLTHSLVKMFQLETANAADINQAFNRVRSRAYNALGFDPFTVLPTNPIAPNIDAAMLEKTYALLIGGGAYVLNAASMKLGDENISYTAIEMMTTDFSDCRLDGVINSETIFEGIMLNNEIIRFRNNHAELYTNVPLPNIDQAKFCNPTPEISIALPSEIVSLAVSSGTLSPAFNTSIVNYSLTVASSSIEITATADTVGTRITFDNQTVMSGETTTAISLATGNNFIEFEVIAEDGVQQTTYGLSIVRNDAPVVTSPATISVVENSQAITTITSTDTESLSYNIEMTIYGVDGNLFQIDSTTGVLNFVASAGADYEIPLDSGADNIYNITLGVTDGISTTLQNIEISIIDTDDTSPTFVATAYEIPEASMTNTVSIIATDPEGPTINYSLTGGTGADQYMFVIDSTTGSLTLISGTLDYEAPTDANSDGTYEIEVFITDTINPPVSAMIYLSITNQIEFINKTDAGIKAITLTWDAITGADTYRVFAEKNAGAGYVQIGIDATWNTLTVPIDTHLIDWSSASLMVEAYSNSGSLLLSSSPPISLTQPDMLDAIGYIKAADPTISSNFGDAISISIDGNTMAIGAPNESAGLSSSGAVYLFIKSGNSWIEQQKIKSSDFSLLDYFGASVDLSEDGNTLVVGANGVADDTTKVSNWNQGAVYVYQRISGMWSNERKIRPTAYGIDDNFGADVAISGDASTIIISETGHENSGSAHVYQYDSTLALWISQGELTPIFSMLYQNFGESVDISGDGNTVIIGSPNENSTSQGIDSTPNTLGTNVGAAYIFKRDLAGSWNQDAYMKAFNADFYDEYGTAVAISADGLTVAVSAPLEDSITTTDSTTSITDDYGSVYLYTSNGVSTFQSDGYIKPAIVGINLEFGASLSLNSSGSIVAVGAVNESGNSEGINGVPNTLAITSGAAYVFKKESTVWMEQSYVKAKGLSVGDLFGSAVSLNGVGDKLLISAAQEDSSSTGVDSVVDDSMSSSGAVYLY